MYGSSALVIGSLDEYEHRIRAGRRRATTRWLGLLGRDSAASRLEGRHRPRRAGQLGASTQAGREGDDQIFGGRDPNARSSRCWERQHHRRARYVSDTEEFDRRRDPEHHLRSWC